ncbi:ribonuclease BN, partial [Frigoribacterium faeni]|nr:ribonuclease BN [Frigoribacterium faeni]
MDSPGRPPASPRRARASKPQELTDVSKPSWGYVLGKTLREFTRDQCTDLAAGLTYYAVL